MHNCLDEDFNTFHRNQYAEPTFKPKTDETHKFKKQKK